MTDLRKAAERLLEALDDGWVERGDNVAIALRQALAQPEQEPVAWITPDGEGFRMRLEPPTDDVPLGWKALYTAPSKPWVGLTEWERNYYNNRLSGSRVAEDIEFELRSRNEKN